MDENVIHEADGYRVRLAYDESPEKPYNDGGAPIWRVEPSRNYTDRVDARHEDGLSSYQPHERIAEAIDRLWFDGDTLERYLRIFHGATAFERWHSGNYGYFTCDPEHWRTELGITDEIMQREGYADGLMDEWQAWCNGEVYVVVVEEQVHWQRVDSTGTPVRLVEPTERDTWEQVEAVGGYYGYDWAEQSAIDALSNYVDELAISCDRCPWTIAKVDENERWDALFQHMTGEHAWRLHQFRYGPNMEFSSPVCQRSGCNTMGTGDFVNDGECEGTD